MNYENQLRINIVDFDKITHKEGTSGQFLQPINWEYFDKALSQLSGNAFKLWLYLLRWEGKKYYEFSPTHLCEALNIGSRNTVKNAKEELIRNNYLVNISTNVYEFHPDGNPNPVVKN